MKKETPTQQPGHLHKDVCPSTGISAVRATGTQASAHQENVVSIDTSAAVVNSSHRPAGPAAEAAQLPRVAWLGQRSARAGNGLVTYSRELTEGLRRRGQAR
jgi:hypothetical protein